MDVSSLLIDGIERSREAGHQAVEGLDEAALRWMPGEAANPIGWLVWHLARQQDHQIAELANTEQVWLREGWQQRFGLDLPPGSTGFGHTPQDVARVVAGPELLLGYLDAAVASTAGYLRTLSPGLLDDIVDENWDPPVRRGVRLVSIVDDAAQHAGQAAYVRGLLQHRPPA